MLLNSLHFSMSLYICVVVNSVDWHVNSTRINSNERNRSEMFIICLHLFVVFILTHHSVAPIEVCMRMLLAIVPINYSCKMSNFIIFVGDVSEKNKYVHSLEIASFIENESFFLGNWNATILLSHIFFVWHSNNSLSLENERISLDALTVNL